LFESNWKNGISLLFSGSTAIFSGVIYKGRNVMALVVAGVLIGATVLPVFLGAWNSISGGDTVGALITAAVGVFIWIYSATLKSGNIPE
jgi:hypothetical protein